MFQLSIIIQFTTPIYWDAAHEAMKDANALIETKHGFSWAIRIVTVSALGIVLPSVPKICQTDEDLVRFAFGGPLLMIRYLTLDMLTIWNSYYQDFSKPALYIHVATNCSLFYRIVADTVSVLSKSVYVYRIDNNEEDEETVAPGTYTKILKFYIDDEKHLTDGQTQALKAMVERKLVKWHRANQPSVAQFKMMPVYAVSENPFFLELMHAVVASANDNLSCSVFSADILYITQCTNDPGDGVIAIHEGQGLRHKLETHGRGVVVRMLAIHVIYLWMEQYFRAPARLSLVAE